MRKNQTPSVIEDADLPVNIEAERAVIGSIFREPEQALDIALDKLQGAEFYMPAHAKIFESIIVANEEGQPIDIVTIASRLQEKGWLEEAGGVGYLSKLASSVPTASHIGHYADIVIDKFMAREVIAEYQERIRQLKQSVSAGDVIAATQTNLESIAVKKDEKQNAMLLKEIIPEVYEDVEKRYANAGKETGISSGFRDLDAMTTGFQPSDLIILAARPSVGKTAFALNVGKNAAETSNETVAIFSLEMSKKQLVGRMICAEGNIDATRFRTGHLQGDDWEKLTMALGILSELPIVIDDTPSLTVAEVRSRCRRIKKEYGLGMILIDYLQLIAGRGKTGENRQEEISFISRTLKQIARELEVPVIALSQLSRGVEQRQDKHPMLSDLRESGSIEQDADIVAFLYRDDYYNKETEKKNIIEVIIAKQRNGPVGTVELGFLKNFNKFVSLDRGH